LTKQKQDCCFLSPTQLMASIMVSDAGLRDTEPAPDSQVCLEQHPWEAKPQQQKT
jgi:hypothetical protein